ncbi:unnamed protein product [Rotaria sordida]|uniref:Uncharacterized protein n=2 Tax=Rotaria sordida TaxID=392033 RepID=A0A814RJX8_9BILA|nr:unnamed protein product [Rotaria sordida]
MQNQELYQYQDELSHLKQHGQTMCFYQRRQYLLQTERSRDIYLNQCKLYEDIFNLTMERLSHSIQVPFTSDQYARQLSEY